MFTLENNELRVQIKGKGAELTSIIHKQNGLEYLWQADPQVWGKHSPVLFPIVGTLKENTFFHNGKGYTLSRHGFAREKEFAVTDQTGESITFSLQEDESTLQQYPFRFVFSICYTLHRNELQVAYQVHNNEPQEDLLFSVGGHPAFRLPLAEGTVYENYELRFSEKENAGRWPISKEGLIEENPQPLLNDTDVLPLSKDLFSQDALVFKHLRSQSVRLQSSKTPHGLEFRFPQFPFLGLWAAPGADFLCIEPWCGIADSVNSNQQLVHKEGIQRLKAGQMVEVAWSSLFF